MKSSGALQAVIILMLVASAASCEVAREYSNRVFKQQPVQQKPDSTMTALRFMEFDSGNAADSIDLKDVVTKEYTGTEGTGIIMDTTIKAEKSAPLIEDKDVVKTQPVDAIKGRSTRNKKVRQ